jgi:hypothetical protein
MLKSVDDALKSEFGIGLTAKKVHILDPFTGTGIVAGVERANNLSKYMSPRFKNTILNGRRRPLWLCQGAFVYPRLGIVESVQFQKLRVFPFEKKGLVSLFN